MKKQKVLIDSQLETQVAKPFRRAGFSVDFVSSKRPDLASMLRSGTYVAVIVSGNTRITSNELNAAGESLRVIGVLADTMRYVNVLEANYRGVVIKAIEFGNSYQVANLTRRMIVFMLSKQFQKNKSNRAFKFPQVRSIVPDTYSGFEMSDKTFGLIGCGSVAQALANEISPYCRRVIGYDYDFPAVYRRFHSANPLQRPVMDYCQLSEVMKRSDVISIHTRGWVKVFKDEKLCDLKRKPYIIDTSRDSFVNDKLLLKALKRGKVRGIGITVPRACLLNQQELPENIRPMAEFSNVLLAPSLGESMSSSHKRNARALARSVISFLKEGDLLMAVNPDVAVGDVVEAEYPQRIHNSRPTMRLRLNV